MATLQDILSGNFPAAQRYAEGYAQMPSYLQDPYLGLSTSQVGNVTKGLLGTTVYHGTSPEAAKAIQKKGFDLSKSADGSIWFTTDPNIGEVAATGKGGIIKSVIDENKIKLGGYDEADKYFTDQLISQGYQGLKFPNAAGEFTHYTIFDPETLKGLLGNTPKNKNVYSLLEQQNKSTTPKIPTSNIFQNEAIQLPSSKRKTIDEIIGKGKESSLPSEYVDVSQIVPTQKNVTIPNLKSVKNVPTDEAIAVKDNGMYYLIDGHHRVANQILNNNNNVKIRVLE
jgi:hypothetical protein